MLDAGECLECDVDTSGALAVLTIPPVGGAGSTNLWRVPKIFSARMPGTSGAPVQTSAGALEITALRSSRPPPASWCGSVSNSGIYGVTGDYAVVYSVGNPVETYGGLFASSFDEQTGRQARRRSAPSTP